MFDGVLAVYREIDSGFEVVGTLQRVRDEVCFAYGDSYLCSPNAKAISASLPLQPGWFSGGLTKAFFDGLLPEGPLRRALSESFHAAREDFAAVLSRLNNESVGALVFCEAGANPAEGRGYVPFGRARLEAFARAPRAQSFAAMMEARLSLAGAQAKIGLFHDGSDWNEGWSLPQGCAPSTFIVKAVDGMFPLQTVNEALCLRTASNLGFEVAECRLLPVEGCQPLLAIKRFDRKQAPGERFARRLHQEDFCQGLGIASDFKYEPTDGHYLSLAARLVGERSANAFGDRMMLFSRVVLDWALGNCDNHLKNHSLLWSSDWRTCGLSPLYDLTCTTVYPEILREMGVSLCASRKIDDVRSEDFLSAAKCAGVPARLVQGVVEEILGSFPKALQEAAETLREEGFPEVDQVATFVEKDFQDRCAAL